MAAARDGNEGGRMQAAQAASSPQSPAGALRPRYREEAGFKIHGGCGLMGVCDESGRPIGAEMAIAAMAIQRDRGNGLGAGFVGYGIYPELADHYCLHVMFHDEQARGETESVIAAAAPITHAEPIPTRPVCGIVDAPLLWRYFVLPGERSLAAGVDPDDSMVRLVMTINGQVDAAFVASSGKNMGVFKGVGYPDQIASFYRLEDYAGCTWIGHNRFPTNTPGWWGGAHPFSLLDLAVVHNGELSSYGINRRYLAQSGYRCTLGTDTEVVAYLFDLLLRRHGLPLELACMALASPLWSEIERMPAAQREMARALRIVYGSALLNGPFAIVLGLRGGMVALNDRIKLRPLVAARQGSLLMVASEESALHAALDSPDRIWSPRAGEPLVARVDSAASIGQARELDATFRAPDSAASTAAPDLDISSVPASDSGASIVAAPDLAAVDGAANRAGHPDLRMAPGCRGEEATSAAGGRV